MTDIMIAISLLAAKIAMLAFLIVVAKFVTKRIGAKTANRFLMKIHRRAGYVLAVTGLIHGILSFCIFSTTSIVIYALGFICMLAILTAIATFFLKNKLSPNWLFWHRVTTVIALVTLILHPIL